MGYRTKGGTLAVRDDLLGLLSRLLVDTLEDVEALCSRSTRSASARHGKDRRDAPWRAKMLVLYSPASVFSFTSWKDASTKTRVLLRARTRVSWGVQPERFVASAGRDGLVLGRGRVEGEKGRAEDASRREEKEGTYPFSSVERRSTEEPYAKMVCHEVVSSTARPAQGGRETWSD